MAGVITGHAEADIAGDTTGRVETGGEGNKPDAVKRFVDPKIAISPDGVNGIGETHTFVVDVDKGLGDGAGFGAASTEGDVDFARTDANGAANALDAATSTCDDTGDNHDASGNARSCSHRTRPAP